MRIQNGILNLNSNMKTLKRLFFLLLIIAIVAVGYAAWILYGSITSNPCNYKTIGESLLPTVMRELMVTTRPIVNI